MKFGSREICNVTFKAKVRQKIGSITFEKGQPVLYIDTAKTSTVEGAATTVYATGGRGNTNLIAWEGEKTLTFTVEDALLSPISLSILSGAGLLHKIDEMVHVHMTSTQLVDENGNIDLSEAIGGAYNSSTGTYSKEICTTAPIFALVTEEDGSIGGKIDSNLAYEKSVDSLGGVSHVLKGATGYEGKVVFVDYYVTQKGTNIDELQIDAKHFAGYYYVEAETLYRKQADGKDMPAILTIPNAKIQSNFTFDMAASGDPSTFSFVMDAMPGYTMFNKKKQVLMTIQIIDDTEALDGELETVFGHSATEDPFNDEEPEYDNYFTNIASV